MKHLVYISLIFICLNCNNPKNKEAFDLASIKVKADVPIKVYVFDSGRIICKDQSLFNPSLEKDSTIEMANPSYLIVHPKGTLVWDAGLPDKLNELEEGLNFYNDIFNYSVPVTLKQQYEQIDISMDKIDYIAFSHSHNDHTGNGPYFKNATMIMQETEYGYAFGENAEKMGFDPSHYSMFKSKMKKINGDYDVFW